MGVLSGPTIAPADVTEIPQVVGEKYRVVRLLGGGGMGNVYEAENTWTRRRVAVKMLRPEFSADHESEQRFMREAQTASQLSHPHVVDVLDMGRDAATGALFIVQEFLVGEELRARLEARGALPPDEALALLLPVMDGLAAAHEAGVIHRDIKPENIFLVRQPDGRVSPKLIDFGIAKALRPGERDFRTDIPQAIGTPGYMSPEQARGDVDIDARTDVWALGVVLYEMLSGRMPYDYNRNAEVMIAMVMTRDPTPLEESAPSVPRDLCAAVGQALQRDKGRRTPSVKALADALSATRQGRRTRATLKKNADARGRAQDGAPGRGRRAALAALAVALTLALAVGAVLALRRGEHPTAPVAAVVAPTTHAVAPTPVPVPTPVRARAVTADAAVAVVDANAPSASPMNAAGDAATEDPADDDRQARRRRRRHDEGFK
ncbi:MAG: serine/threonine-protein kinase [Polyangiales bacterium]